MNKKFIYKKIKYILLRLLFKRLKTINKNFDNIYYN